MEEAQALETIWEMPDDLWGKVESVILKGDHPKSTGRKRVNPRPILNGNPYFFACVVVASGTICPRLLVTIVPSIVLFSDG